MYKMILLVVGVLGFAGVGSAQIVQPGQCNTINLMTNFVLNTFATGTWFELGKATIQNPACSSLQFTTNTDGSITVSNPSVVNNFLQTSTGSAVHTTGTAQLSLTLSPSNTPINFWILGTDYNNYAIAISCENIGTAQREINVWQLGRSLNSYDAAAVLAAANNLLSAISLTVNDLQSIDHSATACTQLPVIAPGQPIILSGQCTNANIPVVQNFDVAAFTGTWHEISSYYSVNAVGLCSRAEYTLVGSTVNVVNSQVINQELDTISGTATVSSTDQSARLSVTLNVAGTPVSQELLIIDTNYTGFAVSYSCSNLANNQRQVNAWVLSRSRQVPAAFQTEINRVFASLVDLNQAYLQNTDQSDNACFYYPTPQAGTPVIFDGLCDSTLPVQANFDPAAYMGLWYDIESYPSTFQQGTCNNAFYTLVDGTVDVFNTQVVNQQLDTMRGTAVIPDPTQPARLLVTFPVAGTDQTVTTNYWVMATDYRNYSLVYTCENLSNNRRAVFSWKMSRDRTLTSASNEAMNAVIATNPVLENRYYETKDQSDAGCFYYPEPQPGVTVEFPGECDSTLPVQANFDPEAYMGLWHDIESYPSTFQQGTCNNAFYTLTGGTVDVFNTQVVNQQLDTMRGTAVIPDPTQPARLLVTFPVAGTDQTVTTNYWVMATDYRNYSLVYTCENLSNNRRAVFSWKMSRHRTLSSASNEAMNAVIATNPVLENRYYETKDQSDAGCFYWPEPQPDVTVMFPGQCDSTLPVQANFDPAAYMGLWHDIESYPSTFQQGTCSNAFYTLVDGTVDVFNTQVVNQELDTMRGIGVIPDPTEPAKLLVTFPVAGTNQTVSISYWVLSTDYTSYSLVYTCENVSEYQRALFSWKMSRTKALTAAATAAINSVMANIQVLDSRYYFNTDQSAVGCFYYPTPQPGVPTVFPGDCDNNIAAVPAFNLAQFTGTWHEIEAYPKEQQTGTCVNHLFTAGAGNTLNLVSNQVVNNTGTTANGNVALVSTDGTGRLWLTLQTEGGIIEFPYWILATDYSSYALAYSCVDMNPDYRAVYSWKLSRTQTLPPAATAPINSAITAVQVLDQQYFETIDQSPTGCMIYPEIPAGQPIILQGPCGTVTPVTNFQSSAFAGSWYETARYASARQSGNCAASQFNTTTQNSFTLTQTIVYNERLTVVSGTATLAADGSGTLIATLSDGASLTYTTTINILDTDYSEVALLHSCENVPGTNNRQVYSWILSRSQAGLSQAANNRISQVIANNVDLYENYYQSTGQTNADCFYYPVFEETPDVVVLPGSCPPISGVANFQPAAYLGNWYDVASYPIPSQFGTCPRAEYSLVDGVVTIRNTMVVDGQLEVQPGIARLSATGTGLLQVTFVLANGEEVVAQYYVLGTDYNGYSLVYSCRNLVDGFRQVFSWKLSRTPTLSAEANTAINNLISNTQGLLEEYYQPQSQSDQDCFYVPELVTGESVLFRGSCAQVSGMQGFNAAQYLGWWHEIERYPTDDFPGQCTSANFIQSGNAINVVETGVFGGAANETTSTAVLSANGTITMTSGGVQSTWIVIATDYNTYSLVYSCEDVTTAWGPHRRVWSAKHSKARSLTAAAQTAMNPHIEANPVLHQHLYEPVNQTDSACFHYREDASQEVILPGQCATNIPVQANFDITQFAGTWYQIERYPYPQVSNDGTCVGARYTANGDSVRVQNWEVLDGTLNTIEGTATVSGAGLLVTLPVQGSEETVTIQLNILTTNYDDYALAYTCVNINEFQRSVGAFKLSRSRQLSNAGQFAIETYMASREELHQPYFISISHNDDCEEPSSGLLVKSSIIVMLVCIVLQLVM